MTKGDALHILGREVKKNRTAQRISQTRLAQRVKTSCSHISNIERGVHWPALPLYLALCRTFNKPVPPLFHSQP